ncbi:glycoside hydrolase family 97 protein [Rufibacter sediminis]|uniref:Glycoside hydrolase family 97 protein n=1 Tax=Rufibacter sediminis TaxID=2762756 RepID=A0ABR6VQC5_9BACT|nr:glycoside hydrolase family 97 protein [Rufibacter sediminis]MBC3539122.1 glycoside hydrolase family 97 protein [Rufibacter sediminis]
MVRQSIFVVLFLWTAVAVHAQQYSLLSPDKRTEVKLTLSDSLYYTIIADGKQLVNPSVLHLETDFGKGKNWKVAKTSKRSVDQVLHPVVWQKGKEVQDNFNELRLVFAHGLSLEWRVYNNGAAWRWVTTRKGPSEITAEVASFKLNQAEKAWYPQEDGFFSHNERAYRQFSPDSINAQHLASLPALFSVQNMRLLVTEADLLDYAGMWLRGDGTGGVKGVFPYYPKKTQLDGDRNMRVVERENYIATVSNPQPFPWRIIMVARNDAELLVNQLVYQLASPSTGDFSWVKPGKVQWDWWNDNNITGVDFKAGVNNDTYKYYIDFASKFGLEYVILDEGWSDTRDLLKQMPGINIAELSAYAQQKKVSLVLWANWLALDGAKLEPTLDQFAKWGIKGIKVDFMQRDDQEMVRYYTRVSEAAAKRKMLVDFHGAYKPTGLYRTYPNVISYEGVLGLEQNKGSDIVNPEHNVTIPFIRMAAGPMDYTPGAMLNAQKNMWKPVWSKPMSMGTRVHQLAMYVVYESPLQMLADNPTHYYKQPEAMEFLSKVPTEWEQTIPLQGKVGEYVLLTRKAKNGDWYIGGMTDWSQRDLSFQLSFLGEGDYTMQVWKDGINADRNAEDFKTEKTTVTKNTTITASLAKGGGWVALISKK